MTKSLYLFILTASTAYGQLFSYGIKGGLPMTDFIDVVQSQGASSTTNRYIVGPTGEVHLPLGFSVEFDVLYRHFNIQNNGNLIPVNGIYLGPGTPPPIPASALASAATANAWEFPLLAKYHFKGKLIHPFIDAGVSWDKLSGVKQAASAVIQSGTGLPSIPEVQAALANSTTRGFVTGGGIGLKVLLIHITPEVRYTRWGAKHFIDPWGLFHSNQNQAEFLVGFTF
jgi:hypothetical protein